MAKIAFFSMDVEEWFDSDCLLNRSPDTSVHTFEGIDRYLSLLDQYGIKGTFFVLGNRLEEAKPALQKALQNGHEIALHGLSHHVPSEEGMEKFYEEIKTSKALVEKELGCVIQGYRAPCFSLDEKKYEMIKSLGFSYDCSTLLLRAHQHYVNHYLGEAKNKNVYRDGPFVNFVMDSGRYFFFPYSLSGGAYGRVPEWGSYYAALRSYLSRHEIYIFYVHPFEVIEKKLPHVPGTNRTINEYFSRGRKGYLKRIEKTILYLQKQGFEFSTFSSYARSIMDV
jgi:peptidoglycan/xylan/chitin deacetylase (PgdA/CDA1 family)